MYTLLAVFQRVFSVVQHMKLLLEPYNKNNSENHFHGCYTASVWKDFVPSRQG